ncbi:MAG: ABC transporter permease [Gammaproteobacteria bacterium]|nr:ABC transporter permease [Gammaproteobacteria bacterium]
MAATPSANLNYREECFSGRAAMTANKRNITLLLPALVLYLITFTAPLVVLLVLSFGRFDKSITTLGFHLDGYIKFFEPTYLRVFFDTFFISLYITFFCLILSFPVAILMHRVQPFMKNIILFCVISPLLTSIIVRNSAWMLVLGNQGIINQFADYIGLNDVLRDMGLISRFAGLPLMNNVFGVVLGTVHVYLPFMVLPIYASLSAINTSIEESARNLGASSMQLFRNITWPLSLPGVIAGCTLVFILSMGLYVTPVIMGGNKVVTIPMIITGLVRDRYNWPTASAFSVMLLITILFTVYVSRLLQRSVKV